MVTKPSAVTPPTAPDRDNPATFSDLADAYIAWLTATGFPYIGDAMDYAAQQIEQLGATAPDWVSGASYTDGDVARSLSDRLVYQAITTHSGETTDPASDATNWTRLTVGAAVDNTFTGENDFSGGSIIAPSEQVKTGNYTAVKGDSGSTIRFTSAATLSFDPAATLTNGWHVFVKAKAAVTLDPDGSETIDGETTIPLVSGSEALIVCNGTGFSTAIFKRPPFVQEFTSSGTYTPTAGAKRAYVEVQGAGGGGAGVAAGSSTTGGGGGGGAGGTASKWIDISALTGGATITIGSGGSGGPSGSNNGSNGGNSSYNDTGVGGSDTLTGNGGSGGLTMSTGGRSVQAGGVGGSATGGDLNITGEGGGFGFADESQANAVGGKGGNSFFGFGAEHNIQRPGSGNGTNGTHYGSGGSGAASTTTNNASGGDGADGYVRITEYY